MVFKLMLLGALVIPTIVSAITCKADINKSGLVDMDDLTTLSQSYNKKAMQAGFDPRADLDQSKTIDFGDLVTLAQEYNQKCEAQARPFELLNNVGWKETDLPVEQMHWGLPGHDDPNLFSHEVRIFSHDCVFAGGWPNFDTSVGSEPNVRACLRAVKDQAIRPKYIVFDTEVWATSANAHGIEKARSEAKKLFDLVAWAKDESAKYKPEIKLLFGHYDTFPASNYWIANSYGSCLKNPNVTEAACANGSGYTAWVNDIVAIQDFASNVDFVSPSFYMGDGENLEGWKTASEVMVKLANRYGVPVLPYIWDNHHNAGPMPGQHISGPFWKLQLETLLPITAGAVMWSDLERVKDVKQLPFYKETVAFVERGKKAGTVAVNPRAKKISVIDRIKQVLRITR